MKIKCIFDKLLWKFHSIAELFGLSQNAVGSKHEDSGTMCSMFIFTTYLQTGETAPNTVIKQ
jgi:hypothetical protein